MDKIRIMTPENIEVEYNLADIGSRTAATLIDMLIQGLFMIIIGIIVLIIIFAFPDFWHKQYGWVIGISVLIWAIIGYGYFVIAEVKMNGRTPGKKVLKLRTIRNNGQPISIGHSAIRNLFKVFIDAYGIGLVVMFITKQHKRIGDFVASTIVVAEDTKFTPVTIENLQGSSNQGLKFNLTEEELQVLREYNGRRDRLEDVSELRAYLKTYFAKKFQAMGTLSEMQDFLNRL